MIRIIISQLRTIVPEEELQSKVFWRSFGVMAWVSFLCAALATMLFFAAFDPIELSSIATFPVEFSPNALYTLGFFLFWVFGFSCTALSCVLLALPLAKRQKSLSEHYDEEAD
ncbi:hypothetical protein A3752_09790 [Oleiphilus sp. HI0081]|nr:hypothetical protein A3729_00150 [Oleiphilus sp. HI0043]KZY43764.1 hypothetical protein A3732_13685 [Oleiphilus sp. HI0050]KZY60442.1 hypothetical protein A3735_12465 [Oleiphilus sp. HI0061]KZY73833.1 hypothetical protein A3740_03165 [Oleiphilus sp. HI0068]KZY88457.1 hypothetical protein A3741_00240 [Oleiphilus sp. HI0069]KZY91449.1 hypothetical protein A3743_00650 [Oleiphilus sp. HI0072]KZZ09678.1 hypothetical protein A3749_01685 [Oleiphilus sp. HI0078]KZZ21137.1 hypothetical protein A37